MKRSRLVVASAVGGFLLLQAIGYAQQAKKKPVRALPPKWSEEVKGAFFADARKVLGERPKFNPGAKPASTGGASTPMPMPTGDDPAAGGVFAWSKVVTPETLEDEIKAQKLLLDASVTTPGPFKGGGNRDARKQFSTLAVMFGIIAEYDGTVRWQKDATGIRDLLAQAGVSCKVGTDQSYNQAKLRLQELTDLVGGGTIADLKPSEAAAQWDKVANRPPLMMRLEDAFDKRLKPWLANEGEFKSKSSEILAEAQILAALAEVIQRPGFEFADDESYLEHAKAMRQAASDIVDAVKLNSYEKANTAAGTISNSCTACHEGFRS